MSKLYPLPCCDYIPEDPEGPIDNDGVKSGLAQREKMGHCDSGIVSSKLGNDGKDKYGENFRDWDGNDAGSVF